MVVKVYVSGISGNKEVKKHQQRVMMILDSKNIEYVTVDITEPGKEDEKEYMQQNSNAKELKYPLPPQLFNDKTYCGDYEDFDLSNEIDELDKFLKIAASVSKAEITLGKTESANKSSVENGAINGIASSREVSAEKETKEAAEERIKAPEKEEEAEAAPSGDCTTEPEEHDKEE